MRLRKFIVPHQPNKWLIVIIALTNLSDESKYFSMKYLWNFLKLWYVLTLLSEKHPLVYHSIHNEVSNFVREIENFKQYNPTFRDHILVENPYHSHIFRLVLVSLWLCWSTYIKPFFTPVLPRQTFLFLQNTNEYRFISYPCCKDFPQR